MPTVCHMVDAEILSSGPTAAWKSGRDGRASLGEFEGFKVNWDQVQWVLGTGPQSEGAAGKFPGI